MRPSRHKLSRMPAKLPRLILLTIVTVGFWLGLNAIFPLFPSEQLASSPLSQIFASYQSGQSRFAAKVDVEQVKGLRDLAGKVDELYPIDYWRGARALNKPALERLADCLETNTCGPGEDKVVVLASFHFGYALKGDVSGEDIWANSTMDAFHSLNYTLLYAYGHMDTLLFYQTMPDLVKVIIWESKDFQDCMKRNEANHVDLEEDFAKGTWQTGTKGCIKKEGFEEGIPVWKSFLFHFWGDNRSPLGPQWTLSPIDYAAAAGKGKDANQYLGYSIEARCRAFPLPEHREHRALALGKKGLYFDPEWKDFLWANQLPAIIKSIPPGRNGSGEVKFEIVATSNGKDEDLAKQGLVNLGPQKQDSWNEILAASKVLLGVGNPYLSPSPYDALCFGVPFINPIFYTEDPKNPEDWTKWHTQHNELRPIGPPYVYHVMGRDAKALEAAIRAALDNPIDRYIPEPMRHEALIQRHEQLVVTDWRQKAEERIEELGPKARNLGFII